MDSFTQLLSSDLSLWGLFLSSLLGATLLPGGSELVLAGVLQLHPELLWPALLVGTLGNTLGGMVSFAWAGCCRSSDTVVRSTLVREERQRTRSRVRFPMRYRGCEPSSSSTWIHCGGMGRRHYCSHGYRSSETRCASLRDGCA